MSGEPEVGLRAARVVFTEQFYYPEGWSGAQLPRDVTVHLARRGVRVEVICGSDQYATTEADRCEDPRCAGVIIKRTPALLGGPIHRRKLLKQLVFYAAAFPLLVFRRAPDLFMTQTNPPLLVPLVALTALIRGRPFVIIAQDIYPEVMFAHGMSRPEGLLGRLLTRVFSWAYRRATNVVALGATMAQRLICKGVHPDRIEIISNWATGDEGIVRDERNELREAWGLSGKFVVLYSGNLGVAHDIDTPLAALRILLQETADVRLVFIGQGSRLADAQRAVAEGGVAHAVQFRSLVPAALLPHSLGLADVALVTLREGFEGLVVPSKLLGYMARAIPTLYVGPYGDVEQMLVESGGGSSVRNGDARGMAQFIRSWMRHPAALRQLGAAGERYYKERLAKPQGLERYATLVQSVVTRCTSRSPRHDANTGNRS